MDDRLPLGRLSIIIITVLGSNLPATVSTSTNVCMTDTCIRSAANILEKIDETVDPCVDFYQFSCGNFMKNTVIPEDKSVVSSFPSVGEKVDLQLRNLLEEPVHESDTRSSRLVKTVYASCMNTTKIELEGLSYVKSEFKQFGGWPVVEPNWNETFFDWIDLEYRFKRDGWGTNFFFDIYVGANLRNSTETILRLSIPQIPNDGLSEGRKSPKVKAEYDYLVELAVVFGADKATAIEDMRDVLTFEIGMAELEISLEETTHYHKGGNPTTIRDLQRNFPNFPWLQIINNYLSPTAIFTNDDVVYVDTPKLFKELEDFVPRVKKRTLANYMFSRVVRNLVGYLPEVLKRKEDYFMKTPRRRICLQEAEKLHVAMSSLYVKNLFVEDTKENVTELAVDIRSGFLDMLGDVKWMDREVKERAIRKFENMRFSVGYPDEILDDKKVEDYHRALELDPNDYYLKIGLNLSKFAHEKHVQGLREPYITWKSHSYTYRVKAAYSNIINTLELPATILKEHFYYPDRPQYMNYGALGSAVANEMTHALDDVERQYGKVGNSLSWWTSKTGRNFHIKSHCFFGQYANYTVPGVGMSVDGESTFGENMADNGGIRMAYGGYSKWLGRNGEESLLPGLLYTGRQLFWISAAAMLCEKSTKRYLREMVMTGRQTPHYLKVVVPFKNSGYFGKDFHCPVGSDMNPENKCRIW